MPKASLPTVGFFLIAAAAASLLALSAAPAVQAGWLDKVKKAASSVSKKAKRKKAKSSRSSASRAHASVRGLEEDAGGGKGTDARDFEGLEWLESLTITESEVDRFVREGRLAR